MARNLITIILLMLVLSSCSYLSKPAKQQVVSDSLSTKVYTNIRILQWKHYFDVLDSNELRKADMEREFYLPAILNMLQKHGIPKERAEQYAELPGAEGRWKVDAVSDMGAQGMWQIMPTTALRYHFTVKSMYDPVYNTACAVEYLAYLDSLYSGNVATVLFAYNAGEGRIKSEMKTERTSNPWLINFDKRETYDFAPRVLGLWLHYKELHTNEH